MGQPRLDLRQGTFCVPFEQRAAGVPDCKLFLPAAVRAGRCCYHITLPNFQMAATPSLMQYRREIDGLRALAVLPVILFHGGFQTFSGGFVGVDVFFVISGYLITSIIVAEMEAGTFTLKGFYERRARRILPALLLVLAVCTPFAALWLLPVDFTTYGRSLMATVLMASNIFFATERNGYFDHSVELQPLLHTWSLAVEEHYYLLFPLFLLVTWRFGRRWIVAAIAVLAVASLVAAQVLTPRYPSFSFYLLPTRGWEIAAGALLALLSPWATVPSAGPLLRQSAAAMGLALLAYAVFTFDASTPFPGLYTLVPVLGTILLLVFATPVTLVGQLLGARPLVGLGLISYSAYLWHQPLFAFARQRSLNQPSQALLLALAGLALALAYASWRTVELPFRNRQRFTRKQVVRYATVACVTLAEIGLAVMLFNGVPERLPVEARNTLESVTTQRRQNDDDCNAKKDDGVLRGCVRGHKGARPEVALLGDSHALTLVHPLAAAFDATHQSYVQMTKNGCPVAMKWKPGSTCTDYQVNVLAELSKDPLSAVVVVVNWSAYMSGNTEYNNGEGGVSVPFPQPLVVAGVSSSAPLRERQTALLATYRDSLQALLQTGKRMVLVYPIPEQGWDIPVVAAKALWFRATSGHPFAVRSAVYREHNAGVIAMLDSLGTPANLVRVHPDQILCNTFVKDRCATSLNGELLYSDDNHLSTAGVGLVLPAIMRALSPPVAVATIRFGSV